MRRGAQGCRSGVMGAFAVVAGVGVCVACGPSYQALYEGDARFEHCYALDESAVAMQAKAECWSDWTKRYTYGQTRDRVEYAVARYRALSRAPEIPTDETMMEAAPGEGRTTSIVAPAPTSAFAPPPMVLNPTDAGPGMKPLPGYADAGPSVVNEEAAPEPPGTACSTSCEATWTRCRGKCEGDKCEACAATYRRCMRNCFVK